MAYDLSAFIPEVWSADAIVSRDAKLVMANLVDRSFEGDVLEHGDTIHVPSISDLTAGDVTNDGSRLTFTDIENASTTDITIDQHKHVSFYMTKRDMRQALASESRRQQYTEKAGQALAKAVDTALLAEASNADDTVGSAGTDLDDEALRDIARSLDGADVPETERYLVVHTDQLDALRGIDKLVRADSLGERNRITKAYEAPENGFWGEAYGMLIYATTNVPAGAGSPAGKVNIAFHRSAIALVMQQDVVTETEYVLQRKRFDVSLDMLYGLKTLRSDHMVKVLS